ncbi:hypothetical protein KWC53_004494 [Salmonella enterica]|nr:hypothetical protein [Salmonella enterica]
MDDSVYYKQRCDEVILLRSGDERGAVFNEPMSDKEVADILQELVNGS